MRVYQTILVSAALSLALVCFLMACATATPTDTPAAPSQPQKDYCERNPESPLC